MDCEELAGRERSPADVAEKTNHTDDEQRHHVERIFRRDRGRRGKRYCWMRVGAQPS